LEVILKKTDIILLVSVVLVAAVTLTLTYILLSGKGEVVVVTVDGEEYARLPLDEDTQLTITSKNGTNVLIIKDGEAYISEASCPDKICVSTGKADEVKSIVCLPNRVTVRVESE